MANTKTNITLFNSNNRRVIQYNVKYVDTASESDIVVMDRSSLTGPDGINSPDKLKINQIAWSCPDGVSGTLEWDYSTDALAIYIVGNDELNYDMVGPLYRSGSGGTGDLIFSYEGMTSTDESITVLIDVHLSQDDMAA